MALRLLCVSIFLFLQSALTEPIAPCDSKNTVWRYGYKPEPTCANLFPVDTSLIEGYFCIDNYVRDANDECIYIYDCPQFKVETTTLPSCPAGESFRTELYPEPSCNDLYPEAQGIKEGCYCNDHTVRNPQGKCVSVYECLEYISTTTTAATPVCPAGEYYTAGLYPEPTCDNFFPEDVFIKEGCFCPENQVRDNTGKCISYLTCPQIVTTTTTTTTPAPATCPVGEELRVDLYPEPACDMLFPEYGNLKEACFCTNDNVRNSAGKCVSIAECPQFTTPAPSSLTPAPCADDEIVYSPRSFLPSKTKCIPGSTFKVDCNSCHCNDDGTSAICTRKACGLEEITAPPQICPVDEVWTNGLYPEPSCDNFYPESVYVTEGCFCRENYIRNSEGKCIEIGECDIFKKSTIPEITASCPEGEIFGKGMYPEATCDNFFPDYSEIKEGCFCAPGLVRNSAGKCISMYDCSAPASTTTPAPASSEFECCPGTANYLPSKVCICNEDGKGETCYDIPCSSPEY